MKNKIASISLINYSETVLSGSIFFLFLLFVSPIVGQSTLFNRFFISKTLRIDYLHKGNFKSDTILFSKAHSYSNWAGTRTNLIDPNYFGANRVELYDETSKQLIYSRGYSNLFEEWKTTADGKLTSATFEETLLVPMPKKRTKVVIKRRLIGNNYVEISHFIINPEKIAPSVVKKERQMVLHHGGNFNQCLDITFIADGYTISDSAKLREDFKKHATFLLNCKPYNSIQEKINITGVFSYSEESGITDPISKITKNSAVGCSFNAIGSDRYLMTTQMWNLHNYVESAPTDAIVIICNTDKYGGGGIYNYYATVAANCPQCDFILVHEMGHSISGLADEYYSSEVSVEDFYPLTIEPWEPNITTNVAFDKKWKNLISLNTPIPTPCTQEYENTVGLFEGAGYSPKGIFRPWQNCTMKEIKYDAFCPVCQNAIKKMVDYYSK